MQCPYIGLINQSSTCYMNSFLQYLYMYKEFRAILFSLDVKPESKEEEKDSIPYQLQKLFCKLNLKKNKQVSTKDLCASFQWTVEDVFTEHDVSEFSKLLLQAIKDSLDAENIEYFNWIISQSEGTLSQYIKCETCEHKSVRQENYNEINLIIKNEWENLYFKKLENSLIETIKPIKLSGDNAYYCDKCESKQNAEKGMEYIAFPKVLTFNLNRFVFDYETLQRKKLDEYFEFPLVLDLNKFKGSYKEVSARHKNLIEFDIPIEKVSHDSKINNVGSEKILSTNKGKKFKNAKSSSITQDFLKKARKNMKKTSNNGMEILVDEKTVQNIQENQSLNIINERLSENNVVEHNELGVDKSPAETHKNTLSKMISSSNNTTSLKNLPHNENFDMPEMEQFGQLDKTKSDIDTLEAHEKSSKNGNSMDLHNPNQEEGLDDQTELYSLQAVFIHKGSAFTGHYYIYIKSFENNMWYLFDDYQVQEVNIADVLRDGFGGHRLQISAYMLAYRSNKAGTDVSNEKIRATLSNVSCPHYMRAVIEQEMKFEDEILKKKALEAKKKKIKHKVFYKLEAATIEIEAYKSFAEFEEKCFEVFKIAKEERHNCRLRLYNKFKDEMLNTYEGKKNESMDKLKLNANKNFIIEVKEEEQKFEKYKAEALSLKLVFWTPQANEIEFVPEYKKLEINKTATVGNLISKIKTQHCAIINENENINIVYKHTYKNGSLKGENLSLLPDKKLVELFVINNTVLYIDTSTYMSDSKVPFSHWADFFEKENNKIVVNFNYPVFEENANSDVHYTYKLKIDMNLTMRDLKNRIRDILQLDPSDDFIIKKGGKSGIEIKDFTKIIRTFRIINNSFIFLLFGKSTSVNEIKVSLYVAVSELQTEYHNLSRDLVFLKEMAINPYLTPSKLLEDLPDRLPDIYPMVLESNQSYFDPNSKPLNGVPINIDSFNITTGTAKDKQKITNKMLLDPENTRLREKTGNILTKYYHNYSLKNQGVVERKKIVVELLKRKLESNEILVYFSKLNCKDLTLSPAKEIIVNKKFNLLEFSNAIIGHGLDIDINSLEATKIRDVHEFIIEDILDHCFFDMSKTDMLLSSAPFYLETDGCLFM